MNWWWWYFSKFAQTINLVILLSNVGQTAHLYEDGKEEKESLVHGGEVDPGVEGDEEDQLHQEGGVDEDVGQTGPHPDCHAGCVTSLKGIGEPKGGPKE